MQEKLEKNLNLTVTALVKNVIQQYLRNNGDEFYVTVTATIIRFQFVTIKLLYPNGIIIFNILFSIKYAVKSGLFCSDSKLVAGL